MNRQIQKWTLRLTVTGLFITALLLIIVLNPILIYANSTTHNNFTIYHNSPIDASLFTRLDQAKLLLHNSEFYNDQIKLDICLNDGSAYPTIINTLLGQALARGFYNKVVISGTSNCKENYVELNGYHWNMTQLLAHEMIHCLQFFKLGLWESNPIADIPNWKWEGYAEYISRQREEQKDLAKNIALLEQTDKNSWGIVLKDSTITPREYCNYWTLVQYCMDIKNMSYQQLLNDTTSETTLKQEMTRWYDKNKHH